MGPQIGTGIRAEIAKARGRIVNPPAGTIARPSAEKIVGFLAGMAEETNTNEGDDSI